MKKIIALTLLAPFALFLSTSCSEDEDPQDYRAALLASDWMIADLTLKISSGIFGPTIDGYAQLPDCMKDDLFVFLENGDLNVLQNQDLCNPAAGEVIATGSWSLDGTNLTVTSSYFTTLINQLGASSPVDFEYDNETFLFDIHDAASGIIRLTLAEAFTDPSDNKEYQIEIESEFEAVEK